MTLSIWRYSHLALALFGALFILIASVTGIILAFEPISNQLHPYAIDKAEEVSVAQVIGHLKKNYAEVYAIEIDENGFLKASILDKTGESSTFYINPNTGLKIGELIKKKPFFEFATNLHRSLFLKSTGRFIIGLASLLLCLIAVTGVLLIAKRQGGFKRWFSKVVKEDFNQYAHVILGRYTLIPILIITLTGVFLSLERFAVLPNAEGNHTAIQSEANFDHTTPEQFEVFKTTHLDNLISLEFPFSSSEDDYFILKRKYKEVYVHQYSGNILSQAEFPLMTSLLDWSIILHTGRGTVVWSIILVLSCIAILYFMYSGFAMTLKRTRGKSKFVNRYTKDNAEYILLTGSETGNTNKFATQFAESLIKASNSVYVDSLNNYDLYPQAKQLIVFTATYGEGDAPSNANLFLTKLQNIEQDRPLDYAVVGFGSLLYPDYCKFAIEVNNVLQKHNQFIQKLPLFKINNQSIEAFKSWSSQWNIINGLNVQLRPRKAATGPNNLKSFKVITNSGCNIDNTFKLTLKPQKPLKFESGDLFAIYPKEGESERLYSIGKVDQNIVLSVKKHINGLGSNLLHDLKEKDTIKAKIKHNPNFHFPSYTHEVIMISNGTGIAPFLGMISEKPEVIKHLFWGGRTQESLSLYSNYIDNASSNGNLSTFNFTFSQQGKQMYVQDIIEEQKDLFCDVLSKKGVVMICGSIAMQNAVLERLGKLTTSRLNKPLSDFEMNDQLQMDCY